jgi:hypothetical protein
MRGMKARSEITAASLPVRDLGARARPATAASLKVIRLPRQERRERP